MLFLLALFRKGWLKGTNQDIYLSTMFCINQHGLHVQFGPWTLWKFTTRANGPNLIINLSMLISQLIKDKSTNNTTLYKTCQTAQRNLRPSNSRLLSLIVLLIAFQILEACNTSIAFKIEFCELIYQNNKPWTSVSVVTYLSTRGTKSSAKWIFFI